MKRVWLLKERYYETVVGVYATLEAAQKALKAEAKQYVSSEAENYWRALECEMENYSIVPKEVQD